MEEKATVKREKISNLIENYRIDHKLTQHMLAAHMNDEINLALDIRSVISKASIYQWESQANVPNTLAMAVIAKLAQNKELADLARQIVDILEERD